MISYTKLKKRLSKVQQSYFVECTEFVKLINKVFGNVALVDLLIRVSCKPYHRLTIFSFMTYVANEVCQDKKISSGFS